VNRPPSRGSAWAFVGSASARKRSPAAAAMTGRPASHSRKASSEKRMTLGPRRECGMAFRATKSRIFFRSTFASSAASKTVRIRSGKSELSGLRNPDAAASDITTSHVGGIIYDLLRPIKHLDGKTRPTKFMRQKFHHDRVSYPQIALQVLSIITLVCIYYTAGVEQPHLWFAGAPPARFTVDAQKLGRGVAGCWRRSARSLHTLAGRVARIDSDARVATHKQNRPGRQGQGDQCEGGLSAQIHALAAARRFRRPALHNSMPGESVRTAATSLS
jgi:hypothetical protein